MLMTAPRPAAYSVLPSRTRGCVTPGSRKVTALTHEHHQHETVPAPNTGAALNKLAWSATLHCLTGCAIGEVLGMALGTAWGWSNLETIVLAVALAFVFGYSLTIVPLLRAKLPLGRALGLAFASDTASITVMEVVDNLIMLAIPGAMDAHLDSPLFWGALIVALAIAAVAAFPVNRWLIARGRGHAVLHEHHKH